MHGGNQRFHIQLYRNSSEKHHAGLPETKFGAKYFLKMHNKVCYVASTNNNLNTFYAFRVNIKKLCLPCPRKLTDKCSQFIFPQLFVVIGMVDL